MSTLSSLPKQFLSRSAQKSQRRASPLLPSIALPASLTNIAVPLVGAGIVLLAMVLFSSSGKMSTTRGGSVRQDFDRGGNDNNDDENDVDVSFVDVSDIE